MLPAIIPLLVRVARFAGRSATRGVSFMLRSPGLAYTSGSLLSSLHKASSFTDDEVEAAACRQLSLDIAAKHSASARLGVTTELKKAADSYNGLWQSVASPFVESRMVLAAEKELFDKFTSTPIVAATALPRLIAYRAGKSNVVHAAEEAKRRRVDVESQALIHEWHDASVIPIMLRKFNNLPVRKGPLSFDEEIAITKRMITEPLPFDVLTHTADYQLEAMSDEFLMRSMTGESTSINFKLN